VSGELQLDCPAALFVHCGAGRPGWINLVRPQQPPILPLRRALPRPRSEGDEPAPGRPRGALALVLRAAPHPRFEREGADLAARVKLPLHAALAGGAVPVRALDGR
jgi:hypothetical protein